MTSSGKWMKHHEKPPSVYGNGVLINPKLPRLDHHIWCPQNPNAKSRAVGHRTSTSLWTRYLVRCWGSNQRAKRALLLASKEYKSEEGDRGASQHLKSVGSQTTHLIKLPKDGWWIRTMVHLLILSADCPTSPENRQSFMSWVNGVARWFFRQCKSLMSNF